MGISCNKGLFRKFRYSFSTDKFNEIKYDELYKDGKRDRMYDLPSQFSKVSGEVNLCQHMKRIHVITTKILSE